jgi:hypothetical protein
MICVARCSMTCVHACPSTSGTGNYAWYLHWQLVPAASGSTGTRGLFCPQVGVNVWQARRSITDVHKAWVHRLPEAPAFPSKPSRARLAATLMRALLVGLLLLVLLSAVLLAALGPSRLAPSLAAVDGQLADGAAAVKEVVLAAGEQVQQVAVGSLGAVAQVAARLAETVQAVQLADGQQEL